MGVLLEPHCLAHDVGDFFTEPENSFHGLELEESFLVGCASYNKEAEK